MKPIYCTICFIMLALLSITVPAVSAGSDIDDFRSCSQCGMDRKAYGYSRVIVTYKDGRTAGVCSLHCAVTDIDADKKRDVASVMVADRDSRVLIHAEKAVWVMGGRKRGVMTQRAKWAFASQEAAQSFVDSNGGQIITWDAALQAAREDAAPSGIDRKR
ncbi:MAG: nitrous oxide reductase accessory protein NosL [Desulfuromonadaceae bacterium]